MAIIKCPECGHQVSDQAKTCPSCGVEIAGKVMRCPDCGEIIFKNQEMCPNCHRPIVAPNSYGADVSAHTTNTSTGVSAATPGSTTGSTGSTGTTGTSTRVSAGTANHGCQSASAVSDAHHNGNRNGNSSGSVPPINPTEKPKKKGYMVWVVALVIALVVGFCAMYFVQQTDKNNEQQAYENAMQSSDMGVLQNYLDLYTDAPQEHVDSIQSHLDKLKAFDQEWMNAVTSNSKSALEDYLRLHPDTPHKTEALVRIDSIDWGNAKSINTSDSYENYINNHADGSHIDEANMMFEKMKAQTVTDADKQMVKGVFHTYFTSIAEKDEGSLISTLGDVLGSFLHSTNVTPSQVVNHMHKLYEAADINNMHFKINNDWKIDKKPVGDDDYVYQVSFSVIQTIDRTDPSKGHLFKCQVSAKVSSDGKISDLDMRKQQVE